MKKTINLKFTITFLTIFATMLALCFSSFAFAQTATESQDPEPEPVPEVDQGHIQLSAQTLGSGTASFRIGATGEFTSITSTVDITPQMMDTNTQVYLKLDPDENNAINKEATKVSDGTSWMGMNDSDYTNLKTGDYFITYNDTTTYGQYAHLQILETRAIDITLTEASKQMLTDKLTLIAGHGDKNDVKITTPSTSNTINVDKGTEETLILSFAIKENKYFIPNITVNNQVYPTVDTGMTDEEGHILICSTLKGSAASVSSFKVDLSIFAQLTCTTDSESMEIVEDLTRYEYMKDGEIVNDGNYSLAGSDTEKDHAVNDALATYDLSLSKDGDAVSEITGGIDTHLLLDASVFTEEEYKVVRNHEGQVEALDTTCEVVRDPGTGVVKGIEVAFNSDKFSEYSIVPANWQPAVPEESTTAQTGDATPIIPFVIAALFALGLVAISSKKNALSNK